MSCKRSLPWPLWQAARTPPIITPKLACSRGIANSAVTIPRRDTRQNCLRFRPISNMGKRLLSSSTSASPESIFSNIYRDINISDGPIRVYEHGPQLENDTAGSKPPVLLLHGAMLDTAPFIWRHLMPDLSAKRRVLAIDMPRHGGSRPWPSNITLDQTKYESVLTEVLDALSLQKVSLIGLSMGGGVATGYSLSYPSRVSALVTINPGGLDAKRSLQFTTWLLSRSGAFLRWSSRLLASSPDMVRRSMAQNFVAGTQTRDFDELMEMVNAEAQGRAKHNYLALDDWQIAAYGPWKMNLYFTPRLGELGVPSLWMHGEKDKLITADSMRRAAESATKGGRFVDIPDAGHIATLDQPETVHANIEEFLDSVGV